MKAIVSLSLLVSTSALTQFLDRAKNAAKPPVTDVRPRYDPFGLYPENAPERQANLIQSLEQTLQPEGPVRDPLHIYPSNSNEVDVTTQMSASVPFLKQPALLDGSLPGDRGFDPLGFAQSSPAALQWQRNAEIKHARLAMLAAVGWPLSELLDQKLAAWAHLPTLLNEVGHRVPSVLNGGLDKTPLAFWAAALGLAAGIETFGLQKEEQALAANKSFFPGDLGFDPLHWKGDSTQDRFAKAETELFHGRLAMLAVTGYAFQEFFTQTAVTQETPFFFHVPFL